METQQFQRCNKLMYNREENLMVPCAREEGHDGYHKSKKFMGRLYVWIDEESMHNP